jgi:transposase
MLSFPGSLKVYLAVESCDMRKSFNGLYALAEDTLKVDPKSGALFVFCNKRRNRIKILYFDGTGLWVMSKRLEQGTFSWPKSSEAGRAKLSLTPEAFAMLTDGIDLRDGCRRSWYERD